MTLLEAIHARHSVRSYQETPITGETKKILEDCLANGSARGGVKLALTTDAPEVFSGAFSRLFGNFRGVRNFITLAGPDTRQARISCGYWGEEAVLQAQMLGLNTCWVGLSYTKREVSLNLAPGEKLFLVIAVGYGATQGTDRRSKRPDQVATCAIPEPAWFTRGIEAALLAPTACNQQKFHFSLRADGRVEAREGHFFYSAVDLGIVRRHFEIGAGKENFEWACD